MFDENSCDYDDVLSRGDKVIFRCKLLGDDGVGDGDFDLRWFTGIHVKYLGQSMVVCYRKEDKQDEDIKNWCEGHWTAYKGELYEIPCLFDSGKGARIIQPSPLHGE